MKILNIILTSQNGGAEQVFIDYTRILKKLNHQVIILTKNDAPYFNQVSQIADKSFKIANKFGYYDIFAINKIAEIILKNDCQAVIAHIGKSSMLVKKAVKKISKKTDKKIFTIAVNHSDNVKRSIGCDLIFSVNKKIFLKTIKSGQAEDKSFVMPNAIDLSDKIDPDGKINLSQKNEIIIGAIGRFDAYKGFDHLIKAIKILAKISADKKINKKFILRIAGSGYFESNLRALVKELDLEDKVDFVGWIADKKNFFQNIDIFCLPSLSETFGLVILEAMKYSKPIISTMSDGPCEILKDNFDALMVDLNKSENLDERIADKILEMISDDEKTSLMVERASQKLIKNYSYYSLEQRLGEIFGNNLNL
jgi:glycosyltransferase involved in cell wall biosynthesis